MKRNLTMLTDFYELTMGNGYFENGIGDRECVFDLYFRRVPDGGGFAVMCGLEQVIEYLKELRFDESDIEFLRSKGIFSESFLRYLADFRFSCDVWAIPEGTPIFPNEPLIIVKGPAIQAQFVETMLLLCINHQSLIATKATRICKAADGRAVMEFGSRRAQGGDGAMYGARASYIGGCAGTACTISDKLMGTPAMGTMAHSWVQMFDTELDAFRAYAKCYPDNCMLLVDTYNVLHSGIPNAITVFRELAAEGHKPAGIRIDSGDITYLSRKARGMLDEAGFSDAKICISNSLDEYIIEDILRQGACVDSFGVGERLITSRSEPVFGGVYKLVAADSGKGLEPKIKISENVAKVTTPGFKDLYRFYDNRTGKAMADLLTVKGEEIDGKPYIIFDPEHTYKRKVLRDYTAKRLLVQIFDKGECVYESPSAGEIREYCAQQLDTLWDEVKRFENPHTYYVDMSEKLWNIKHELLIIKSE
ncbi:MAG: nicotinate phosphoribosyltransferase [Oscillospiraceae bacterium]|nr:nicotinate phosphoribosyltransferase [Oscillospiraceae bacterium]